MIPSPPKVMGREDPLASEWMEMGGICLKRADACRTRVDYTPEDDDFMCRWLAAFPHVGSALTKKTYTYMVRLLLDV